MKIDFNFCPRCGQPLQNKIVFGQERRACQACGFVHFEDPKVAVAVLLSRNGAAAGPQVLLVRRAVVPRIGFWALPAGFVDAGELPHQAAQREVLEETGLRVRLQGLLDILPLDNPDKRGFLMLYRGQVIEGALNASDDVSEVRWFAPADIPWSDLAFSTTHQVLRRWRDELTPEF